MAVRRTLAVGVAITALVGGCSGGDDGALDPSTLGQVRVDPTDAVCAALEAVLQTPRVGLSPLPRAELTSAFAEKDAAHEALAALDPERFGEMARVFIASRRVLLDAWGDDGADVIRRADLARMRVVHLAADEAVRRGESVPTARDIDEARDLQYHAVQDCVVGDLDLPTLERGDERPPPGFVIFRDAATDVAAVGAVSTDGEKSWMIPGLPDRALTDFDVSSDGTQVLANAFDRTDGSGVIAVADIADLRRPTGSPWRVLVEDDGPWGDARWTADGRRIIAVHGPYDDRSLAVVDIETGGVTDVADLGGWHIADGVGAVLDDRVILNGGESGGVLRSVDLASGESRTILELPWCVIAGTVHLGDDRLLLSIGCDDDRATGVYSVRSDGSDLRAVFTGINSSLPRLSPDGEWMAMNVQDEPSGRAVPWIARTDGTQARPLGDVEWAGFSTWIDTPER